MAAATAPLLKVLVQYLDKDYAAIKKKLYPLLKVWPRRNVRLSSMLTMTIGGQNHLRPPLGSLERKPGYLHGHLRNNVRASSNFVTVC
jgi:hypothetical protein